LLGARSEAHASIFTSSGGGCTAEIACGVDFRGEGFILYCVFSGGAGVYQVYGGIADFTVFGGRVGVFGGVLGDSCVCSGFCV